MPAPYATLLQLRGVQLEDADRIIEGLRQRGLTSFMVRTLCTTCCPAAIRSDGTLLTSALHLLRLLCRAAWTTCVTSPAAPLLASTRMS